MSLAEAQAPCESSVAVSVLAAAYALDVHRSGCPLTEHGLAHCAASAAVVLLDPAHSQHERVMERAIAALTPLEEARAA